MTGAACLSVEQREALEEIANIGMGEAGASIAAALGEFVVLSVPRTRVLPAEGIGACLEAWIGRAGAAAVHRTFHGDFAGEALTIVAERDCIELACMMGCDASEPAARDALLLDVGSVIIGASLGSIATQLDSQVGIEDPALIARRTAGTLLPSGTADRNALIVEMRLRLERRAFAAHVVLLLEDRAIGALTAAIDRRLAALA